MIYSVTPRSNNYMRQSFHYYLKKNSVAFIDLLLSLMKSQLNSFSFLGGSKKSLYFCPFSSEKIYSLLTKLSTCYFLTLPS